MRIGAQEIRIRYLTDGDNECDMGKWDWMNCEILLRKDLSLEAYSLTLLHEELHAISDLYGLDLKESTDRVLEQGLGAWIKDNPSLVQDVIDGIQGE